MRHGEAVAVTENPGRPLSQHGRETVEQTARAALKQGAHVSRIYHSGILRAQETALLMGEYLKPSSGIAVLVGLAPDDDPECAKAELEAADEPLLLVSHLPLLGRLSAALVHGDPERPAIDLLPAALVCFSKTSERWEIRWRFTP